MKNLKIVAVLPALFAVQSVFSQTATHLILSDDHPSAGEKISMTYDPSGTAIAGQKDITATVFYIFDRTYTSDAVELKPSGNSLSGEFTVINNAQLVCVKLNSGGQVDNNNDIGYVYLVYKDKQPIKGAFASDAYFLTSGMGSSVAKIKRDNQLGFDLYGKEFALYPESEKDYRTNYYLVMARLPAYAEKVNAKLSEMKKSTAEDDLMLAAALSSATKHSKSTDSLLTIIRTRFPSGTLVKNELANAIFNEKDLSKKDSLYNVYNTKVPENPADKNSMHEIFRVQLAGAYLTAGDMEHYHKYEALVKNKESLAGIMNDAAYEWAKKGEKLDMAEQLSKKSLDILSGAMAKASSDEIRKNYAYNYDLFADTYALILFRENKFEDALKYEQPVVDHAAAIDPEVYEHYIEILGGVGQYAKAREFAEKALRAGRGSDIIKAELKKDYTKIKGSEAGFDRYLAGLVSDAQSKVREDMAKTMINQPAPTFALKDLDGKTVSLADLKGKVVIVDFWASWCGPCKASFPGMQMAVDKFKDNPDVKFLFLDTWESDDNYLAIVKKFIADNKYSFHVLLDDKNSGARRGKIVDDYGVEGIPTKFIIDKNGNIRFKYVGYTGTPEGLADELGLAIEMTTNAAGVAASAPAAESGKSGSK